MVNSSNCNFYIVTDGIKLMDTICLKQNGGCEKLIPKPTARSAVPGVSPGRGLLIPAGYLHPEKRNH